MISPIRSRLPTSSGRTKASLKPKRTVSISMRGKASRRSGEASDFLYRVAAVNSPARRCNEHLFQFLVVNFGGIDVVPLIRIIAFAQFDIILVVLISRGKFSLALAALASAGASGEALRHAA